VGRLDVDSALLALLIGAMNANDQLSPEQGARAHNIIWSMRRCRRQSGVTVDRGIDRMRQLVERHGASPVITAAAKAIPARLRQSAFAVAADLVLADGKMEPAERRFLDDLGTKLDLDRKTSHNIAALMLIKNGA
jgi:hypothetical protein